MRNRYLVWIFLISIMFGCSESHRIEWSQKVGSLSVAITKGDVGSPDKPLPYSEDGISVVISIQAKDSKGGNDIPFNGWVRVSSRPGSVYLDGNNVKDKDVLLEMGKADGIKVTIKGAFGQTRIWVEDLGFVMKKSDVSQCLNGIDDDGDGMIDLDDFGCFSGLDDSEEGGTYAVGVSEVIWVENLTIDKVQSHKTESSFQGEMVYIDKGKLVVTRVTTDGFYVTDVSGSSTSYNHIFAYNYNTPPHMRVCDMLVFLSGTVSEFYGFTEINFPAWKQIFWYPPPKGEPCNVPEPREILPSYVSDLQIMEGLEAGLVRVRNVTIGDRLKSCDLNGDGDVDYTIKEEDKCQKDCDADPLCTEVEAYKVHGQYAVGLGNPPTAKILVASRETIPFFDPFAGGVKKVSSITGTLRHWKGGPRNLWIIEPRCPDDLVIEGEPLSSASSCVFPRTGEEDYEY